VDTQLDGEKNLKICLFVSTEYTNVTGTRTDGQTHGQTPHDGIGREAIIYTSLFARKAAATSE